MSRELDDKLTSALELAKIGFYRYRFDGTIVSMDRVTFDFFELEGVFEGPQSLIGKNIETIFIYTGPKSRVRKEIKEKGKVAGLEYGFRTLGGKEKWGVHNSYLSIDEETGEELIQVCFYDITERKKNEEEKGKLIRELQRALEEIRTLRGILPICVSCKKVRDDQGYWNQIETYIAEHSEAEFTHSICQECAKKLYPDLVDKDGNIKGERGPGQDTCL